MHLSINRPETQKQWVATDTLIQNWLSERQDLMVYLYKLSVMKPRTYTVPTSVVVHEFLDVLVDYVSAGHFEIYEKILDAGREGTIEPPDNKIIVNILTSTNLALDFNDSYSSGTDYANMASDLSKLSEALADRFEYEDELIELYLKATDFEG